MELDLQSVIVRGARVGYEERIIKIEIRVEYRRRLKKPPSAGANVGCGDALLLPQGLFERHIPLQCIRQPKLRIKRVKRTPIAGVRWCDWRWRRIRRTQRKRGDAPKGGAIYSVRRSEWIVCRTHKIPSF